MIHMEVNTWGLHLPLPFLSSSFCSSSSLELQDPRRWPAVALTVCGCSLWKALATCKHCGDPELPAWPLTLQERGQILRTACPALGGGGRGGGTELVIGSTAPRAHWERVTAIHPQGWAPGVPFLGVLRIVLEFDMRKRASECPCLLRVI